ncbi:MAG: AAA family ATPase [Vallitalea sp.]|jgi:AAA15 family ATPase/GTPase|nr:AAA family ATPase [Vallitalea sp.]
MIHSIEFNNFRQFTKDMKINMAKNITVIAGSNSTGKSTILGILGNSCYLNAKDGKPIIQNQFISKFSETICASKKYDPQKGYVFKVNYSNDYDLSQIDDFRNFRVRWDSKNNNNDDRDRFRLIPKGHKTESKVQLPVLYLGLSRLYPIGETKGPLNSKDLYLSDSEKEWLVTSYCEIFNIDSSTIKDFQQIKSNELKQKNGIGIATDKYDHFVNSAGQDNIGQILLSVLSFIRLKKSSVAYSGGLLLIDEYDATLHASTQKNLFNLLYRESLVNNIQIVFTTHSLSLLDFLCNKTRRNSYTDIPTNNIELIYLSKKRGHLKIYSKDKVNFDLINAEMRLELAYNNINRKKLIVFSEDEETRWFFNNITNNDYAPYLNILNTKLGCDSLLNLRTCDPSYFANVLFILDGDVKDSDIKNSYDRSGINTPNIIKLPVPNNCVNNRTSPEKILYDYLLSLSPSHPLWDEADDKSPGFNITYIKSHGPDTYTDNKERERYKKWFNDNITIFDEIDLMNFWIKDNVEIVDKFIEEFKDTYNILCAKNHLRIIS